MAKRRLVCDGVLVTLKAGCHWRDPATGKVHIGPVGKPGSEKFRPGSPAFRIPALRGEREERIGPDKSIFKKVGSDDTAD